MVNSYFYYSLAHFSNAYICIDILLHIIETVAVNFHDATGTSVESILNLEAGDDAGKVKWMAVTDALPLYAVHADMIAGTCRRLGAYYPRYCMLDLSAGTSCLLMYSVFSAD